MEKISLKEGLVILNQKDEKGTLIPFDLTYRTFNATSKKGGKLKFYLGSRLLLEKNPNAIHRDTIENILVPIKKTKNANHFENRTRNIQLPDYSVVTIHIDFIISINNKEIIY
ncbi:hypothetical protein GJU43_14935 [Flavobacterium sp. LC2016-23]|uniref:hypothetical protein n=1 Tax=Flavobacterium sp. LC2016-23 TaxID=2666330 RepID=UPI0012B13747|nr:hypothetical protein [Flavobacterium sp. LC2016-23]MRX40582.1 hypothetical protein [Flavobacterium sp. LC2016-23]